MATNNINNPFNIFFAIITSVLLFSGCGGSGNSSSTTDTSTGNTSGSSNPEIYPSEVKIEGSNAEENIGSYKIRVQGLNREFSFFRPSNPELKKLPLVIDFHGAGGTVAPVFPWDAWVSLARKEKFFLLKPQAVSDQMNSYTYWNVGWNVGRDDAYFVQAILDLIEKQQDIDIDRVYVTGMSSGGHMAFYTAQLLQDRIAAVAPISGSIMTSRLPKYTFNKPMPICNINGTADKIVNIMGGDWYSAWGDIREIFINNNKTAREPVITHLPDIGKYDGSSVTKYEYRGTSIAGDIDDYRIINGAHAVPGIESSANQDINAYEVIWAFFKKHKLSDPY
ncbi:hydrolase [Cellvibrio zantedeschiae]|uniref:Hydrolase n=1 Tax=Cellvibrio zantedeschiae TaxID=1237077 RepID=A0ABQ3APB8_9GAMM|nr:PHB depolymerase family esterase [Cellvibrio zantedeschiae]GGY63601.1 hydrolase [Cellvibrio zantedeschiae]